VIDGSRLASVATGRNNGSQGNQGKENTENMIEKHGKTEAEQDAG